MLLVVLQENANFPINSYSFRVRSVSLNCNRLARSFWFGDQGYLGVMHNFIKTLHFDLARNPPGTWVTIFLCRKLSQQNSSKLYNDCFIFVQNGSQKLLTPNQPLFGSLERQTRRYRSIWLKLHPAMEIPASNVKQATRM